MLSEDRMSLSFTIVAIPRLRSHSQVQFPQDPWTHFTVSDSRLSQLGGSGPRIYIPQEQDDTVIPPRHYVPFSSPSTVFYHKPLCTDEVENTVSNSNSIVACIFVAAGTCLPINCLDTGCIKPLFICLFHGNCCTCYNILPIRSIG
jgi:hypothetical protein